MKSKGDAKLTICIALVIFFSAAVVGGAVILYRYSYFDSVNTILTFAIGILSLLISIVALLVALSTYFSIDSVNAISSMEGNVLCNEHYNAEYPILVEKYSDCKNQKELEQKLFTNLYRDLQEQSDTCMQFADRIQDILDHILWYAYVDTKTPEYKAHVEKIITLLNKRYESFSAISNGNQYMLKEHIKLIMNVLNYQSNVQNDRMLAPKGQMLNIRGRMFLNSVSKTIYYDYLGLEYHKKALSFLRSHVGFEGEEFLQENMRMIRDYPYTEDERNELNIYLNKAKDAFYLAAASCEEDILWEGYITFNKARIDLLKSIVEDRFDEVLWDESIRTAITARYAVLKLFGSKGDADSFLHLELEKEYYYAKALYLLMKAYRFGVDEKIIGEAKRLLSLIPDTENENAGIFRRTRSYLEDILTHAEETVSP